MRLKAQFFFFRAAHPALLIALFACNGTPDVNQSASSAMPAAVYYNGDILTMEGDTPAYVEALVVRDGKIQFVGPSAEAMKVAGRGHRMVDLQGKTLLPGFIDGHSHITNYADATVQADLSPPPMGKTLRIADIIEALQALKTASGVSDTAVLMGFGYDQDFLEEQRHPTASDLDVAFPTNPVILKHASGHMLVVNTAAMKRAGISAATPDPSGGTIIRKKGSKEPEGLVQEMAMYAFMGMITAPATDAVELKKMRDAQEYYARCGVTTAAEHLLLPDKMVLLDNIAAQQQLFVDLVVTPGYTFADQLLGTGKVSWGVYNNRLKYQGIKMAVDGSPQGKTAFLSAPYHTSVPGCSHDCKGFSNMTQEEVDKLMLSCYQHGVQLYSHCNGDASVDMMIKGHQRAIRALGDSTKDRRTVIIHSQIMRPDQMDLYKRYNLFPSFFTNHTYYWGDVHIANLGKERASYLSPMRDAIDKGVRATNHTDCIVTPLDQLFLLWTSVNRLSRSGVVVGAAQAITPYEGLQALTIHGAYEYFEEDSKGSLTAGKLADLVILDKNPLKVDPKGIKDIQVVETIKEGKTIYSR